MFWTKTNQRLVYYHFDFRFSTSILFGHALMPFLMPFFPSSTPSPSLRPGSLSYCGDISGTKHVVTDCCATEKNHTQIIANRRIIKASEVPTYRVREHSCGNKGGDKICFRLFPSVFRTAAGVAFVFFSLLIVNTPIKTSSCDDRPSISA